MATSCGWLRWAAWFAIASACSGATDDPCCPGFLTVWAGPCFVPRDNTVYPRVMVNDNAYTRLNTTNRFCVVEINRELLDKVIVSSDTTAIHPKNSLTFVGLDLKLEELGAVKKRTYVPDDKGGRVFVVYESGPDSATDRLRIVTVQKNVGAAHAVKKCPSPPPAPPRSANACRNRFRVLSGNCAETKPGEIAYVGNPNAGGAKFCAFLALETFRLGTDTNQVLNTANERWRGFVFHERNFTFHEDVESFSFVNARYRFVQPFLAKANEPLFLFSYATPLVFRMIENVGVRTTPTVNCPSGRIAN